ncbi:MAG: phosphate acyltransferase PlsX [Alphaproteobacteria bacterium]|nr:phosphate acyltransferase PlsX [Alphaproteobacteria bacterium]MDA7983060.1 phosphate acyltransferase PlsX [Alphaproteobacteria bacterium]MDA7988981.1 phosphate acyltransferase PlsX [Alphaproteobacteria bacterium]MDA8009430.1 phosphate acyltransferase PlsX [Alphaproteobacteria bacterium]MDA8030891.1 phosphate acyltransferase PlsX [Alphaproteobacteria bacterium]
MAQDFVLAIDAMGGENAPRAPVAGAALARERHPALRFLFVGDQAVIERERRRHSGLAGRSEILHAPDQVPDDAKPSLALRRGQETSMFRAIESVARGDSVAAISGGNTGALMAMALRGLKAMEGVHRPAIASFLPSAREPVVLLDLGATLQCTAANLVEFAIMGTAFARTVRDKAAPSCALLNIGEEDVKGHEEIREAARILQETAATVLPGPFLGFIEAHDIASGRADVVVADGFTGNIALKTAEGTAQLLARELRATASEGLRAKAGALLLAPALRRFSRRFDARLHNGAVFLGLDGIAIKSHGRMDEQGFANALLVADEMAGHDFLKHVREAVSRAKKTTETATVTATGTETTTTAAASTGTETETTTTAAAEPRTAK